MFRKLIVAALLLCAAFAIAQTPAKDALKSINEYRSKEVAAAREARKAPDMPAIQAEVKSRAEAAIKDVDPVKVDPKDAHDWAQLFQLAGKHKEVCALSHRFLTTNPSTEEKFAAQMLMMVSCNELGEGEMLAETLLSVKPPIFSMALVNQTVHEYIDTVKKAKGTTEAIKVLDAVQKSIPTEDPKVAAQRMLGNVKKREAANPPSKSPLTDEERLKEFEASVVMQYEYMNLSFIEKKAELLAQDGKKSEAAQLLKDFIAGLGTNSGIRRSAEGALKQLTLEGASAPALTIEKGYGTFNGLESLKGKVVILDFFAHWCGPCIAAFPEMKRLFAEYKPKGLEIVAITTYYGYYKAENNVKRDMPRDIEYSKMADFIAEHKLPWPVVYGERANFEAYGVTGIPHVVVIDKQGVIRKIKVGYNPAGFAEFESMIAKLLDE